MNLVPIVLFVYRRADYTSRTLTARKKDLMAGAGDKAEKEQVAAAILIDEIQ